MNEIKIDTLPPFSKVVFVHYQCQNFNEGEEIYSLQLSFNDETKEYTGQESESIEAFSEKLSNLKDKGFTIVHWNQNRSYYGTEHINARYKELTAKNLNLDYGFSINLSAVLINKYGDNYISHPRLDNLVEINNFSGHSQHSGDRTFGTDRVILLAKIYYNAQNGELKTNKRTRESKKSIWFDIGLRFASGEVFKLKEKGKSFDEIAENLGFEKSKRPYFSSTYNKLQDRSDIFGDPRKKEEILKHLNAKSICEKTFKAMP